jgi:hypothetical protein
LNNFVSQNLEVGLASFDADELQDRASRPVDVMIRTASSSGRQWQCHATGQVRLRPFFQQRLPPHNVIDRFRDVGGVVAYTPHVLGAGADLAHELLKIGVKCAKV